MSYLRWTLDFALVFSGHEDGSSLDVYTDASWSPTGEKSHSGLSRSFCFRGNLEAWTLASAEAELISCVSGAQLGLSLRAQLEGMVQKHVGLVIHCDKAAVTQLEPHTDSVARVTFCSTCSVRHALPTAPPRSQHPSYIIHIRGISSQNPCTAQQPLACPNPGQQPFARKLVESPDCCPEASSFDVVEYMNNTRYYNQEEKPRIKRGDIAEIGCSSIIYANSHASPIDMEFERAIRDPSDSERHVLPSATCIRDQVELRTPN
eukprot:3679387-Amphidinium_carterae.3